MKLVIGSDHAGLALKKDLIEDLSSRHEVIDVGTFFLGENSRMLDRPLG